jgi:anion-transporting  ArsA/GET3 family ATPase
MSTNLSQLRCITVVGKGGVGKTSVSAALAVSLAQSGRRVLIAMCNAKDRISYLMQTPPIGPEIRFIAPNIDAVNMEPAVALEEYGMMVLKVRALYKLVFENRLVRGFLRGTPGVEAWAMLGKAQYHVFETVQNGRPRYDTVIIDAPATGHGLELLRVPKVILDVVPPGLMRHEAERAWNMLTDPKRSGVLIVTIPEELPANEAIELHQTLRSELQLPVAGLVVNMVLPPLFTKEQGEALAGLRTSVAPDSNLAPLVAASSTRHARELAQLEHIEHLRRAIPGHHYHLPTIFGPDFRRAEIETLARRFQVKEPLAPLHRDIAQNPAVVS